MMRNHLLPFYISGKFSVTFLLIILVVDEVKSAVNPQNIQFRFYTGNNPNQYQTIPLNNLQNIVNNPKFNRLQVTKIYIGGYRETGNMPYTVGLLQQILIKEPSNVLQLIWSSYNSGPRNQAIANVRQLAPIVAQTMDQLISNGVSRFLINFIGFSMGAQFAGIIGLSMQNTIAYIAGLDPSGPGFPINLPHLSNNFQSGRSALYIQVVHTDSLDRGTTLTDVDLNLIANAGIAPQPGCLPLNQATTLNQQLCSHLRAIYLSINFNKYPGIFYGVQCNSYQQFTQERYSCGLTLPISSKNPFLRGNYYFNTTGSPPYGEGLNGVF